MEKHTRAKKSEELHIYTREAAKTAGLMSVPRYAEYRKSRGLAGGTRKTVYNAIESGRCPVAGRVAKADGGAGPQLIDPSAADRAWAVAAGGGPGRPVFMAGAPVVTDTDDVPDYNESRARHEHEKAQLAELKRKQLEGSLRDTGEVEREWVEVAALAKSAVLATAPKLASAIAIRFDLPDDVVGVLQSMVDAELRAALVSLGADDDAED